MVTRASFLAPPNMSLTTFFSVGVEWEEAEVCMCKREEVRKPRTVKCAEIFKHFSSTATKGAGTIIYQREKANEHSFSSETPLTRRGGLLVLRTGGGSITLCSSASQVSTGNKLNWRLWEADCAEHLQERQESHEMTIALPGKGSNRQTTCFLERDTPMSCRRSCSVPYGVIVALQSCRSRQEHHPISQSLFQPCQTRET